MLSIFHPNRMGKMPMSPRRAMLVAAPAAHPKSSHDVDAEGLAFSSIQLSRRDSCCALVPGAGLSRAILTMNSLMNFYARWTPGMAEVPNSSCGGL
jgi:hypothetical protein